MPLGQLTKLLGWSTRPTPRHRPARAQRHILCTMKVAMLLVSVLFLATAVEALPGAGGRQLAKDKKPKTCKADVCWKACKNRTPLCIFDVCRPPPKCDIAFMENCLEEKSPKKQCKKECKDVFDRCKAIEKQCKATEKMCMKECGKPEPLDCSVLSEKKKKACCKKQCKKDDDKKCTKKCLNTKVPE